VLVPAGPGVLCAMGVLTKDTELDLSRTRLVRGLGSATAQSEIKSIFEELDRRAQETLVQNGVSTTQLVTGRSVDARYVGQSFELSVRIQPGEINARTMAAIRDEFHAVHKRRYGYDKPAEEVELVTFRIKASVPVPRKPGLAQRQAPATNEIPVPVMTRRCYFDAAQGAVDCPVFRRADLAVSSVLTGPAIIEQMDATTIIPPDFTATVDEWENLILRCASGESA